MTESHQLVTTESPSQESPALIFGLGNPGSEYAAHRHNVGVQVVDALARVYGVVFSRDRGAKAHVAKASIGSRSVLLAKPKTFMNQSGRAASRLCRHYQVPPERMLVVYDDLDLRLGRLRLRPEGGSGGHRGMRSIIESLGTHAFPRLRVGIDRPPGQMDPAEYVLQPFAEDELSCLKVVLERAVAAVECWLAEGIVAAMDEFNRPGDCVAEDCQENRA